MLYYIHGYLSEPNSAKGTLFKQQLNAKAIKYRNCEPEDLVISDCLNHIEKEIENDKNVVLIGSSLGGFLAAKTALEHSTVKQTILLNPAIIPPSYNISKLQGMPRRILQDIQDVRLFKEKIASEIFILIGTMDDLIPPNWPLEFAIAQKATIRFLPDDHSFTYNLNQLPEIIGNILDKNIKK